MADQMGTFYLSRQQRIGYKKESNPGTVEALADADYNVLAYNLKLSNATEENVRKYAIGDPYPFQSVMGRRPVTVSFSVHVQGSGAAGTDPVFFKLLEGAGFALGTSSLYRYALLALPGAPATIEVQEVQSAATSPTGKQYTVKGCMATKCSAHWDNSGELQRIDFEYIGALYSVTDLANGAINTPVLTSDTTVPPAILGITCTFGSNSLPTQMMSVDFGLKTELVQWPQDSTGFAHAVIGDFDPVVNFNPLIQTEVVSGFYAALTNTGTLASFSTVIGSGIGAQVSIVAPNAQVVKALDLEERNMVDSTNVMLRCIRTNTATNPCIGIFMLKA